ncbi:hypothetical protein EYF80_016202 [Liparis tanakae]|uniref:Uncharacterized protein n=1 Tax=Liparis tanakae TaxID=230148 RepID=A0A4Z2I6D5_9TELE|nr:hypothetical protein EYF80_016202 [Liparis tanakae]
MSENKADAAGQEVHQEGEERGHVVDLRGLRDAAQRLQRGDHLPPHGLLLADLSEVVPGDEVEETLPERAEHLEGRKGGGARGTHTHTHTSAQYCSLASASMWATPPRTSAFIRAVWAAPDSRWSGGRRAANRVAKSHQLSQRTTTAALREEKGEELPTRHQQLHRVVGELRLRAPRRQVVRHLLQEVPHHPPGRAQRQADLRGRSQRGAWAPTCSESFSSISSSAVRPAAAARDSTSDVLNTADSSLGEREELGLEVREKETRTQGRLESEGSKDAQRGHEEGWRRGAVQLFSSCGAASISSSAECLMENSITCGGIPGASPSQSASRYPEDVKERSLRVRSRGLEGQPGPLELSVQPRHAVLQQAAVTRNTVTLTGETHGPEPHLASSGTQWSAATRPSTPMLHGWSENSSRSSSSAGDDVPLTG